MASTWVSRLPRLNQRCPQLHQLPKRPFPTRPHLPTSRPFGIHDGGAERFLPMILRPSLWRMLTPIPLRKEARRKRKLERRARIDQPWNPATFFVLIFMLIGSWSLHFVNLRHSFSISSRQLDAKISKLQEVLKRMQAGEDVDVEEILGTGDPLAEQQWDDVMREIQEEDQLWNSKERKAARRKAREEANGGATASSAAEDLTKPSDQFVTPAADFTEAESETKQNRKPGFY